MATKRKKGARSDSGRRHDPQVWQGQARLGLGWALFTGRAGDNAPHRHHAVQIALAHRGSLRVWTADKGWLSAPGVMIGADVQHRLAESDLLVTLLYLEGESEHGRAIQGLLRDGVSMLPRSAASRLLKTVDHTQHQNPAAVAVPPLLRADRISQKRKSVTDPVISASLVALPRPLPARLTLAALARDSQLSPSRYAHRFAAHTGMALRPYLRWLRLLTAVEAIVQGTNLTDAAHSAGFSDSAHFSRTFRRHFGIAPRVLLELVLSGPARQDASVR